MLKPYYQDDWATIYRGDCREVLPGLEAVDSIITDPVWPNAKADIPGRDDPYGLLREVAAHWPTLCNRAVVQLGCDSDPRILLAIPPALPFFRLCWLEYACPTRKGRLLYTGDVAYVFGIPPKSAPGRRVLPGRYISTKSSEPRKAIVKHKEYGRADNSAHPCARRYQHVRWLVSRFTDGLVLDPFAGSGTTLRAAKDLGIKSIGIEIEEKYCEIAVKRLRQESLLGLLPR